MFKARIWLLASLICVLSPSAQAQAIQTAPYFPFEDRSAWIYHGLGRSGIGVSLGTRPSGGDFFIDEQLYWDDVDVEDLDDYHFIYRFSRDDIGTKVLAHGPDDCPSNFSPPVLLLPAEMVLGQPYAGSTSIEACRETGTMTWSQTASLATISVPAGTFETLQISESGTRISMCGETRCGIKTPLVCRRFLKALTRRGYSS